MPIFVVFFLRNNSYRGGEWEYTFCPLTLATDPLYDFVDIAQGVSDHEFGAPHQQAIGGGERLFLYRKKKAEAGTIRPLVVSKDYSRDPKGGDLVFWIRFVRVVATAWFHRLHLAGDHPESVSTFQHEAGRSLGRFIAEVPFWKMVPAPGIVRKIPEGISANVLAGGNNISVIQLAGVSAGGSFLLSLFPGTWTVGWINPATGKYNEKMETIL